MRWVGKACSSGLMFCFSDDYDLVNDPKKQLGVFFTWPHCFLQYFNIIYCLYLVFLETRSHVSPAGLKLELLSLLPGAPKGRQVPIEQLLKL